MLNRHDLVPFEKGKNAKELGVDVSRTFIVLNDVGNVNFKVGDLIKFNYDDGTISPYFKRISNNKIASCYWHQLAYAPNDNQPYKPLMSNILDFFRNLTATPDDLLLKELGIENPVGVPTETGLKLSQEINYKANRTEIIELAKKMKAEQEKK